MGKWHRLVAMINWYVCSCTYGDNERAFNRRDAMIIAIGNHPVAMVHLIQTENIKKMIILTACFFTSRFRKSSTNIFMLYVTSTVDNFLLFSFWWFKQAFREKLATDNLWSLKIRHYQWHSWSLLGITLFRPVFFFFIQSRLFNSW